MGKHFTMNRSVSSNLSAQLAGYGDKTKSSIASSEGEGGNMFATPTPVSLGEDDELGTVNACASAEFQPPSTIEPRMCNLVGAIVNLDHNISPRAQLHSSAPNSGRCSPLGMGHDLPDLSVSPLTASSFQTMERQYDRDTWRMHHRIASARMTGDRPMAPTRIRDSPERPALVQRDFFPRTPSATKMNEALERGLLKAQEDDGRDEDGEDALCIFDLDLGES
jgi:hypothetical protein